MSEFHKTMDQAHLAGGQEMGEDIEINGTRLRAIISGFTVLERRLTAGGKSDNVTCTAVVQRSAYRALGGEDGVDVFFVDPIRNGQRGVVTSTEDRTADSIVLNIEANDRTTGIPGW